jgi:hypothetical protein
VPATDQVIARASAKVQPVASAKWQVVTEQSIVNVGAVEVGGAITCPWIEAVEISVGESLNSTFLIQGFGEGVVHVKRQAVPTAIPQGGH